MVKRHGRKGGRVGSPLSRYLKLMHWNIEGVMSGIYGNKLEDDGFLSLIKGHDLIALTETHASEKTKLEIPGYIVKRKTRLKSPKAKKYSGGIALAIKDDLVSNIEILPSKSDNIMWAQIKRAGQTKHLILGIVYISPITSTYTRNVLSNLFMTWEILLEEIAHFRSMFDICLVGDFNARTSSFPDYIVNDDDKYTDLPVSYSCDVETIKRLNCDTYESCAFGNQLLELCKMTELRIVNGRKMGDSTGKKTCHQWNGSSTVDYMIADTSVYPLIQTFQIMDTLEQLSDHCPFSTIINLNLVRGLRHVQDTYSLTAPRKVKWNSQVETMFKLRLQSNEVKVELDELHNSKYLEGESIDKAVHKISQILTQAAEIQKLKTKPRYKNKNRKVKDRNKPWFNTELSVLRKNLKKAGVILLKNSKDNYARQNFFKLKKQYKSAVSNKKRKYKQMLYSRIEELHDGNPKEYWDLFEKLKQCHDHETGNNESCLIDDKEWINHYIKLLGPKVYNEDIANKIKAEIDNIKNEPYFSELDFAISNEEIYKATKTLKNNKAVGIDQINNEMIKTAIPVICNPLRNLFNAMLCNKYYPKDWKIGIIVNLYKSGDILNTDNYRGLTINSCLAKIFNTIMNNRLMSYLDKHSIISDKQIGFKKKARTSDHIFVINTLFRKLSKMKKNIYLCFVDFRKAYDSVWREALMLKLLRTGIRGNFFGIIENMYHGCKSCIKTNGLLSRVFECETGVRQGDVLSPNLFNLYINDLPDLFEGDTDSPTLGEKYIHCLMYADDLVLLSLTVNGLQGKLDKLDKYCEQWSLTINTKKTQVMCMSTQKVTFPDISMHIGGTPLTWVSTYKYLGIEIHSDGKMDAAIKNLCVRGWKATFKIRAAFKDIDVSPATKIRFFDVLVKPIICYGSEVWGALNNLHNSKSLDQFWNRVEKLHVENFQTKFCKNILGVHPKASNAAVMGEVGRFPMFMYIIKTMLRYYKHIEDVKEAHPLLAVAANADKQLVGTNSWHGCLQKILMLFGVTLNTTVPINTLIQRIIPIFKKRYIEHWKKSLGNQNENSGKLYLYRKIKTNFQMEPYLEQVKKRKLRRALTALRISAHRLEIETDRYIKNKKDYVSREDRICKLCAKNGVRVMGDEEHAIMVCPSFENHRKKCMDFLHTKYPNFRTLNNHNKLIFMMTSEDESVQQVSKLVHIILNTPRVKDKQKCPKKKTHKNNKNK